MAERQYLGQGSTTSAEKFWYILGCIYFGAAYFQKVPVKKALSEYGLVEMTGAEKFWYVVQCIFFGAGLHREGHHQEGAVRGPGPQRDPRRLTAPNDTQPTGPDR